MGPPFGENILITVKIPRVSLHENFAEVEIFELPARRFHYIARVPCENFAGDKRKELMEIRPNTL